MFHLKYSPEFNQEMEKVHSIIIRKGFIVESDHPYAYAMQHFEAFSDIVDWMAEHDYIGEFEAEGYFDPKSGAVYGIFDKNRISYETMYKELKKEAIRQAKL